MSSSPPPRAHPRTIGWLGTTALAMGGSNQSIFLISALLIGQENIPGQGTAAIPLLFLGLALGWMALPGWLELVLMYPNRVGGIAASCAEAFRPYNPVLANLTGVCYWWGWVPCCGLTAILSATAIHDWYAAWLPIPVLAVGIVVFFTAVSLCGIKWVTRLAVPIAAVSAGLAFLSVIIPIVSGSVDWHQATQFRLTTPFPGWFGALTSSMAGLYLIGFAAPAFETAACHVGEMIDCKKNVPRAMFASAGMATFYFAVIPVVWLGVLGPDALSKDLAVELGPVFAPLFGASARGAAVGFMVFNMFHGTFSPVASAARALSQLGEDGLLPEIFSRRMARTDAPWFATIFTAAISIIFLLMGDPLWLIAAANMTYLIGISLPSVAVWLLRKNSPHAERPYRAPRGMIAAGMVAAGMWMASTILGFQQFGMRTVIAGLVFAYAGALFYAYRRWRDRRKAGLPGMPRTLHFKLTGAMLLVLILDGSGYLIAVNSVPVEQSALISALEDIFVAVALLTISVGLVLPGVIAHSVLEVSKAADHLTKGPLADFSRAMKALSDGNLDAAYARVDIVPVQVRTQDEIGDLAASFNLLQNEIAHAAVALDGAREGVRKARGDLQDINTHLEQRVLDRTAEVVRQKEDLQASETRKAAIVQSALDGIVSIDHLGKIIEYNPAAERIFGHSRADVMGKDLGQLLIPPSSRQQHRQGLNRYLLTGEARLLGRRLEVSAMRSDGSEFPIELTINRLGVEFPPTFTAFVRDITDRKRAEEVLRYSEERFRQFAENITDVFWMTSVDMKTLHYVSPTFAEIWGLSTESLYADPRAWVAAIVPEDRERVFAMFDRLKAETDIDMEYRISRPDGSIRWIHDRGFQVRDAEGKPYRKAGIAVDITDRKLTAEKLIDLNKQLVIAARQSGMAEVASSVLHNAGNVLNSVNVSATLVTEQLKHSRLSGLVKVSELLDQHAGSLHLFIQNDPRGRQLPEYFKMLAKYWREEQAQTTAELDNLNRNIQHIREIIATQQSLTGVSGLLEPAKLSHIIQTALSIVDASLKHDSITVNWNSSAFPPSLFEKSRLLQILVNLLQNAREAMLAIAPVQRVISIETVLGETDYTVTVRDSGAGIKPEDLTRIFSFGFTTKSTGHGIGLHSSSLSAQDMGGTLTAESAGLGMGAAFILVIPCKPVEVRKSVSAAMAAGTHL